MKEKISCNRYNKETRCDKKNHEFLKRSKPKTETSLRYIVQCKVSCMNNDCVPAMLPMYNHTTLTEFMSKLIDVANKVWV